MVVIAVSMFTSSTENSEGYWNTTPEQKQPTVRINEYLFIPLLILGDTAFIIIPGSRYVAMIPYPCGIHHINKIKMMSTGSVRLYVGISCVFRFRRNSNLLLLAYAEPAMVENSSVGGFAGRQAWMMH